MTPHEGSPDTLPNRADRPSTLAWIQPRRRARPRLTSASQPGGAERNPRVARLLRGGFA
jgi:hypothetical protein